MGSLVQKGVQTQQQLVAGNTLARLRKQKQDAQLQTLLTPPDLTDTAVQMARRRAAVLLTAGQGRRSSFLTGYGVKAPTSLLGG